VSDLGLSFFFPSGVILSVFFHFFQKKQEGEKTLEREKRQEEERDE
jgi:hypothetical protein